MQPPPLEQGRSSAQPVAIAPSNSVEIEPSRSVASSSRNEGSSTANRSMMAGITDGLVDKACKNCRTRKVKCDKIWPTCGRCKARNDKKNPCEFENLIPISRQDRSNPAQDVVEHARIAALEQRMSELEFELSNLRAIRSPTDSSASLPASPRTNYPRAIPQASQLAESIRHTFLLGAESTTCLYDFIRSRSQIPIVLSSFGDVLGGLDQEQDAEYDYPDYPSSVRMNIGESSLDWRLALPELARALSIHLLDSFFISCCGYLKVFERFHSRIDYYRDNVGVLDAANQVAVAAFCAMGGRSSPHSALLGIPVQDPNGVPSIESVVAAGSRREQACRALQSQATEMYNNLELAFDATVANLEVGLAMAQMLIFSELKPRKSKVVIITAFNQFKELQDSRDLSPAQKKDMIAELGIPLFVADAIISAYAKRPSPITEQDMKYFQGTLHVPNFETDSLSEILDHTLLVDTTGTEYENGNREIYGQGDTGVVTHDSLNTATNIISVWMAQSQRSFARIAPAQSEKELPDEIRVLWSAIDQVHTAVQRIQQVLVNINYTPHGCHERDGCADLHLRYITRLDRDLMDVIYLLHSLITELKIEEGEKVLSNWNVTDFGFQIVGAWQSFHQESEKRVRKSLKLVAFYSQLYITSRDRHMTFHLFWQLELLPNWCEIVLQRFSEINGPETEELEVSETELDWLLQGLKVASFYHPVAEARIYEFEKNRRTPRIPSTGSSRGSVPSQDSLSQ